MTPPSTNRQPKQGERTGTSCPICGNPIMRQERYGRGGDLAGFRLVCSLRGCPWQREER